MSQKRRDPADCAGFTFAVVERKVALGRRIELKDLRDMEPTLEGVPDVGSQPIATAESDLMARFLRVCGTINKITAQLADILEQGAIPFDHLVPKPTRRKL